MNAAWNHLDNAMGALKDLTEGHASTCECSLCVALEMTRTAKYHVGDAMEDAEEDEAGEELLLAGVTFTEAA